jgi:acyl carrier protein
MEKLQRVIVDVFLLSPEEFRLDLTRQEVDTWDSLGVVSLAVGIQEAFGYHFTPDEATSLNSVQDIVDLLRAKGIELND